MRQTVSAELTPKDVLTLKQVPTPTTDPTCFVLQREGALWSLQRTGEPKQFSSSVTELVNNLYYETRKAF